MALKASVHIETERRYGRSVLKKAQANAPFKIANISERCSDMLTLMLMNSSPGVLDGDAYDIRIDVGPQTSLHLQTQSYQRLFFMQGGAAQNMQVVVGEDSSFAYLPHPVVPHAGSSFVAKNKIVLSRNSVLLWGEVVSCGRKLNDEVFRFSAYRSITEIFQHGRLVAKENLLLDPRKMNMAAIGQMEGFSHQATFFYLDESVAMDGLIEELRSFLSGQTNAVTGITALAVNGLVIRLLGQQAEVLHGMLKETAACIQSFKHFHLNRSAYV